jgi:hypothetical protein
MTLLDILIKAGLAGSGLIALLRKAAEQAPDLAPAINKLIDDLLAVVSQDNLVRLATVLPREIADIFQGKIDPRDNPSNLA